MELTKLLSPWLAYMGKEEVTSLSLDSREVTKGSLFFAIDGSITSGKNYINDSLKLGAIKVIKSTLNKKEHGKEEDNIINFYDLENTIGLIAKRFYFHNKNINDMKVIGITGTNGKTSISHFIAKLCSKKVALMGTLGIGIWPTLESSLNTTSDAININKNLSIFLEKAPYCVMEVSSHGLVQNRVKGIDFSTAIFTNLTRDHLDFHKNMENYEQAKYILFNDYNINYPIINKDDLVGKKWLSKVKNSISYSIKEKADFYADNIKYTTTGIEANFHWDKGEGLLKSNLFGEFNLSNIIAALAALYLNGEDMNELLSNVEFLTPVDGRMESFKKDNDKALMVIDYAHTPDALEKALKTLRKHCNGELWCIFGCGGNRDKGKRSLMGEVADKLASKIVLTNDNSRDESPQSIIEDIKLGIKQEVFIELDREKAIKYVYGKAKSTDIILIAGKGHETYQEIAGKRYSYNEREIVKKISAGNL